MWIAIFTACIVLFSLFWCSCDVSSGFYCLRSFLFSYFGAQVMWLVVFTACVVLFSLFWCSGDVGNGFYCLRSFLFSYFGA